MERRSKLNIYLDNNKDISLEKTHQMQGAIKEMDHILNILKKHKQAETHLENNPKDDVFLFKPIHDQGFIHNAKEFLKDVF
jgi:hypothetical protein